MPSKFICLIDANIENISDVPFRDHTETVNLHSNKIPHIGRGVFPTSLINLDLSSNFITTFCGDESLQNLRRLNLSANNIKSVRDFGYLSSLVYLDLSYNQLKDLSDFRGIYDHPLTYLDVRSNRLASIGDLIRDLSEFKCLKDLLVADEPLTVDGNPICSFRDFREILFNGLPQILRVDSFSREIIIKVPSTIEAGGMSLGDIDVPCKEKSSCNFQPDRENGSHKVEQPLTKTIRHVMIQVSVDKREKRKLAQQLAKITAELDMERSLRAKSETFQECIINKIKDLGERNNQNLDLTLDNLKLKEQLHSETQNRDLLEKRLGKILKQMQDNIQSLDEVVTLRMDWNRLCSDAIAHLEAKMVADESTLRKSLSRAEKQKVERLLQDRIARACEAVRRQADVELEAAQKKYSRLEAEFRFALHSESQRYSQVSTRAMTAEKTLQKQRKKLRTAKKNLNLAATLVSGLKKTVAEQWKELQGSDRSLSNARDLLGEMNKTIKELTVQLSLEKNEKSKILEEHKVCCDQNDAFARLEEESKKLEKLQEKMSINNSALSNEVSELTSKLKSAEEGVRIKAIQLDDQLDTIKQLKTDLSAERDKSKELAKFKEENKQLQSAIDHLTGRKDEMKSLILELQNENDSLKGEILAYQDEINYIKEKLCRKESDWLERCAQAENERDEALARLREMSEEMKELARNCKSQLESTETALSKQAKEANQRLLETQEAANQRIYQLEEEMRQILLESMNMRGRVETTLKHLVGELGYQCY
ncbi:leucine rich repeat and coiled coil [Echinococcus multilocularis]|uniref:Leucine rich repeat and coiled coil n=1 Tax=Echinococcus multilocularis TaxID=6211 RepID=A0A068YH21_ECHMU|nr:leucine rich repeat and coiled coil [Echinococcus multilocularis]